jgi:hypothetical protein
MEHTPLLEDLRFSGTRAGPKGSLVRLLHALYTMYCIHLCVCVCLSLVFDRNQKRGSVDEYIPPPVCQRCLTTHTKPKKTGVRPGRAQGGHGDGGTDGAGQDRPGRQQLRGGSGDIDRGVVEVRVYIVGMLPIHAYVLNSRTTNDNQPYICISINHRKQPKLAELNLRDCSLEDDGAVAVAECVHVLLCICVYA